MCVTAGMCRSVFTKLQQQPVENTAKESIIVKMLSSSGKNTVTAASMLISVSAAIIDKITVASSSWSYSLTILRLTQSAHSDQAALRG